MLNTPKTRTRIISGGIRLEGFSKRDIIAMAKRFRIFIHNFEPKSDNAGWYGYGAVVQKVQEPVHNKPNSIDEYEDSYAEEEDEYEYEEEEVK